MDSIFLLCLFLGSCCHCCCGWNSSDFWCWSLWLSIIMWKKKKNKNKKILQRILEHNLEKSLLRKEIISSHWSNYSFISLLRLLKSLKKKIIKISGVLQDRDIRLRLWRNKSSNSLEIILSRSHISIFLGNSLSLSNRGAEQNWEVDKTTCPRDGNHSW